MTEARADDFLGGRLSLLQPVNGYRAGADPVFLAASVPARAGHHVLDLGCGVGTALFCLGARVDGVRLTGVELQVELADLARQNAERAGIAVRIVTADLAALPPEVTGDTFDHVMFNPPFFDRDNGTVSADKSREGGRGNTETLGFWMDVALRRVRPGGTVTLIHRIETLPEALAAFDGRAGGIRVLPLQPRHSRPAKLFLLQAKKGSRTPFCLLPPLVLHQGDRHEQDGDSYSEAAASVLRKGAALSLSD